MSVFRLARRAAGAAKRWLLPTPEVAAWRSARRLSETTPRFTPGSIRLMDYELQYSDLLAVCPMWHDIFVEGSLKFNAASEAPRILDCGANIGLATLWFKRLLPKARVTAYEADPRLHAMLCENLHRNGAADVDAVHAAVWDKAGDLVFNAEGSDSGMVAALPGAVAGTPLSVPAIRLRDVIAREPIDLLKLDIEGAEGDVLADCAPVLDRVAAIEMDLHEFDPAARQAPRVLEQLTRAGFVYAVGDLIAQPWRPPVAAAGTPFPGRALVWTMMVWAWRPRQS